MPNERKAGRISSVPRMPGVIEEVEEEELSDHENRPGGPVGHSEESQRPVDAAEKGKGKERESRRVSEIKDT